MEQAALLAGIIPPQEQPVTVPPTNTMSTPMMATESTATDDDNTLVDPNEWSETMITLEMLNHKMPGTRSGGVVKPKCTFVQSAQGAGNYVHGVVVKINDILLAICLDKVLKEWPMLSLQNTGKKGAPFKMYSNYDLRQNILKLQSTTSDDDEEGGQLVGRGGDDVSSASCSDGGSDEMNNYDQPPAAVPEMLTKAGRGGKRGGGGDQQRSAELPIAPNHWEALLTADQNTSTTTAASGGAVPSAKKPHMRVAPYKQM